MNQTPTTQQDATLDVTFTETKARALIRAIDRAWDHCNVQGKREFQPLHDLAATLRYGLKDPEPPEAA